MKARLLLYGVDEFAGALISRRAAMSGFAHIAAGRDIARVAAHANALSKTHTGLAEPRIFGLGDKSRLAAQLDDVAVIMNCCPPFSETAPALLEACLATRTHYLDLSANRFDLAQVLARDDEARQAGIVLAPGANFDVAAPDALSARLATMLPSARRLTVAVSRDLHSRAEAHDLVESCRVAGELLKDGNAVAAAPAARHLEIDFGKGGETAFLAPWRCESLAAQRRGPYTTVESFEVLHPALLRRMTRAGLRRWMFRRGMRRTALERKISGRRDGPTPRRLAKSHAAVWGEALGPDGNVRRARLETPAAHLYTADAALLIARNLLDGKCEPGFRWPSEAGGAALVEAIEGVTWREIADPSETDAPDLAASI
jgi:short subunit dehydrogenase-like uncharacterized protein